MNYLFLLFLTLCVAATSARDTSKSCVLDDFDNEVCTTNPILPLPAAVRAASAPCSSDDAVCWCMLAVKYTNQVRVKNGVAKMLKAGPVSQLDNAIQYAEELNKLPTLKHQVLEDVTKEVRCERWVGGENIAYNYASGDIAKACVRQWERSKLHFQNLIRDWFKEVVVGVHVARDGRVHCVQTFSLVYEVGTYGDLNGARCMAVSDSSPFPGDPGRDEEDLPREPSTQGTNGGSGSRKPSPKPSPASKRPSPTPTTSKRPSPKPVKASVSPTRKPAKPAKGTGFTPSGELRPISKARGYHSCRCLEVGSRCWSGMRWRTGGRCSPFRAASEQPRRCKRKCCQYCRYFPNKATCKSSNVRAICSQR